MKSVHVNVRDDPFTWYTGVVLVLSGILTVVTINAPANLLPYLIGGFVMVAVSLAVFVRPLWALYFIVATSALSGMLRSFDRLEVGSTTFTVSGLRWVVVAASISIFLLINLRRISIPKYFLPFGLFVSWAVIRWATVSADLRGLKDVLFYGLPPLTGLFSISVLGMNNGRWIRRVEIALLYSAYIPLVLYSVLTPLGFIKWTENGPAGVIGPRPVATYLLVVLSLSLAEWAYGDSAKERRRGRWFSFLAIGLITFTLSRMATATGLLLLAMSRMKPFNLKRIVACGLLTAALALAVFTTVPNLQTRLFHWQPSNIDEAVRAFRMHGRDKMWPLVLGAALEKPIIGWGPGSARPRVATMLSERMELETREYPVHNEYLTVFHDLGIIGLGLLLIAWVPLLLKYLKNWNEEHVSGRSHVAKFDMAASLSVLLVVLNSFVDNTLHYSQVMLPVFIILACTQVYRARLCPRQKAALEP